MSFQRLAGRLKYFNDQWSTITQNSVILGWTHGYRIPFIKKPVQFHSPNPKIISSSEAKLMLKEINVLVEKGVIEKATPSHDQFISKIFLTDKANGEKRFILNLKQLNAFVYAAHFKMEDTRTAAKLIPKNGFMATIDLKDAYYLIPVHSKHKKYLRFKFKEQLYQFTCLPFGLASAPYTFTKLLRPVVEFLRSNGVTCVYYLDDFLLLGDSEKECYENVQKALVLFKDLGFIINSEKSFLTPKTRCKYLGFVLDSIKLSLELPPEKHDRIMKFIDSLIRLKRCKIIKFARFLGILTSACPAVKYGWLYTKRFERQKFLALRNSHGNYKADMNITDDLREDMLWWHQNISSSYNHLRPGSFKLEIFSDASLSGWGAYCKGESTQGWWTASDQCTHINILELKAICFSLNCFARDLRNCSILIRTDNTTALACVNRMGSIQHKSLNDLSRKIWKFCENRNLWIFASYIPSSNNSEADRASRVLRSDTEWSLNNKIFDSIVEKFGAPDIDMFATYLNNKCDRYVSWYKDPAAEAVDGTFTFYAFPPFALLLTTLQKIATDKATGILVVPYWKSQSWYPLFTKMIVDQPIFFGPNNDLLSCPYSNAPHPLSKDLTLVAALLSGKHFK